MKDSRSASHEPMEAVETDSTPTQQMAPPSQTKSVEDGSPVNKMTRSAEDKCTFKNDCIDKTGI